MKKSSGQPTTKKSLTKLKQDKHDLSDISWERKRRSSNIRKDWREKIQRTPGNKSNTYSVNTAWMQKNWVATNYKWQCGLEGHARECLQLTWHKRQDYSTVTYQVTLRSVVPGPDVVAHPSFPVPHATPPRAAWEYGRRHGQPGTAKG